MKNESHRYNFEHTFNSKNAIKNYACQINTVIFERFIILVAIIIYSQTYGI
jgi:hypothetical protein